MALGTTQMNVRLNMGLCSDLRLCPLLSQPSKWGWYISYISIDTWTICAAFDSHHSLTVIKQNDLQHRASETL